MILHQFAIGAFLICFTVVIHAVALDFLIRWIDGNKNHIQLLFNKCWKLPIIVVAVLGVFFALIVEIWIWAVFYIYLDIPSIPDFETALYFSTTTFTTVGYGDVFLEKDWRLVSSFQSANGFILFGWSTAFIFEIISKLYKGDSIDD